MAQCKEQSVIIFVEGVIMKVNPQEIIDNLLGDSKEIIYKFLELYSVSSHPQYMSAISSIFVDSNKKDVRELTFDDFEPIFLKINNDEKKSPRDTYKEYFFKYLFANDIISSEQFNEIWIKEDCIRHFLKKKSGSRNDKDENINELKPLSLNEVLIIEDFLSNDFSKFELNRMSLVWYLLFDTDCSVSELKALTSDDYKDGKIITNKNNVLNIPDRYRSVFEVLSEKQYNGFQTINDIVDRLGSLTGIENLKPARIKITRKANMIRCSNCREYYTNLSRNWVSVNNRIICIVCADKIKKNTKIKRVSVEELSINVNSQEKILESSAVMYTFDELKSMLPKKIDYLKLHQLQIHIGKLGEAFVYEYEINKLKGTEYERLVDNTKALDHSNGYDILSFDFNGEPLFIEVKTTISENDDFYITNNELETAKKFLESNKKYLIYRVYNIFSDKEKIRLEIIDDLFDSNKFVITPQNYLVQIRK